MPPQAQQNPGDANGALWLSALVIVAAVIIWYFFHSQIAYGILKIKLWESYLFNPVTSLFRPLQMDLSQMTIADGGRYSITDISNIATDVGDYFRYITVVVLLVLAAKLYLGNNVLKFRHIYSIQKLITEEQRNWPTLTSVQGVEIDKMPLDQAPWGMSLPPMLFAKKYQLLDVQRINQDKEHLSTDVKYQVSLKRAKAKQVFLMQLGNYWRSADALPVHAKALFAMFAAKHHGDKEAVNQLNRQIALSAVDNSTHLNFQGVEELLAKYKSNKAVLKICNKHAFNYTVMAAMLEFAREDGVYASADFLWLKPIDRRLWYTLNSVGRKTPFAEVGGIHAHFMAEKIYGRKILSPMVDAAVNALEIALSEVLYRPDDH